MQLVLQGDEVFECKVVILRRLNVQVDQMFKCCTDDMLLDAE